MAVLPIVKYGDDVLRRPAQLVTELDDALQKLIDDMIETMAEYHGVGLAAPQVHERVRLFVALLDPAADDDQPPEPTAIINPDIAVVGSDVVEDWEGCLSIPDIRGRVPRAREIRLRAFDREGGKIDMTLHDFPARVAQHETDHLDGILFFDRMRTFESLTFLDEYSRYHAKD